MPNDASMETSQRHISEVNFLVLCVPYVVENIGFEIRPQGVDVLSCVLNDRYFGTAAASGLPRRWSKP